MYQSGTTSDKGQGNPGLCKCGKIRGQGSGVGFSSENNDKPAEREVGGGFWRSAFLSDGFKG